MGAKPGTAWTGLVAGMILLAGCSDTKPLDTQDPVMARKVFLCGDTYLERGRIGLHADCLNSDYRPEQAPHGFQDMESGYTLNNNSIFLNASLDFDVYDSDKTGAPKIARAYTTTAKSHDSNLYAIEWENNTATIAWKTPPFDQEGDWKAKTPDACAMVNTPIVDSRHNIYLADCRYVFSYDRDGHLRFTIPLPGLDLSSPTYKPTWTCPNGLLFTHTGRLVCIQADANVIVMDIGDNPGIIVQGKPEKVKKVKTPQDNKPPKIP